MEVIIKEKRMIEVVVDSYILCDKCNKKIESSVSFDAFECEFLYKEGSVYPEGGYGDKSELDLCQRCGKEAIELLEKHGFKVQTKDWEC